MTSMFVTSCGKDRAPRRRFRTFGALVTFGLSACAGTDDVDPMITSPSATGSVTAVTPGATTSGVSPSVNPSVNPNPVNPVSPVNPSPTTTATSMAPVQPPVSPTSGPATSDPTPVTPTVTGSPTTTSPSTSGPGPEPTSTGPGGTCTIAATGEISAKITTVGVVTFTVDVPVTSAKIEFKNMAGGETMTAPVDLEADGYRTLLLGMKPNATYTYKVVVNDSCSSAEGSLTTGAVPVSAAQKIPRISKTGSGGQPGFYVVSVYSANTHSVILDQDGDIVWYGAGATAGGTDGTSRSRMDWEGKHMWSLAANPFAGRGGAIMKVSMDGETETTELPGTENRHHDLVAVPGGIMTILAHQTQGSCSRIIEYSPDGTAKEIVGDINEIYQSVMDCHPNSISYNVEDDTYVVGDRNASMFVKFDREGNVIWQLGGANPVGPSFQGAGTWSISHGHHLFEQDGSLRMLVFNNASGGTSNVLEYTLNEEAMTAEQTWKIGVASTPVMGDVQRLPNGNTLVALTTAGSVIEYKTGGAQAESVQEFKITGAQVGYVDYRPTLYGVPAKARFDYKSFE